MNDWRSYDVIADDYARVWAERFQAVARHLLALAPPLDGMRLLDLGTGTGALISALGDRLPRLRSVVGCDLSLAMLLGARRNRRDRRLLVADFGRLPFRQDSFDLATANCVMSHVPDHGRALSEVLRVLAQPCTFLMSSWGPSFDPYAVAWRELLDGVAGEGTTQRTVQEVAPCEGHFSSADNVRMTLLNAGLCSVRVEVVELPYDLSVEDYLADRELSSGGRFGRVTLGEAGWRRFRDHARTELRRRFGDRVRYGRPLLLGVGSLA